jgi:hypothetical protein
MINQHSFTNLVSASNLNLGGMPAVNSSKEWKEGSEKQHRGQNVLLVMTRWCYDNNYTLKGHRIMKDVMTIIPFPNSKRAKLSFVHRAAST